MSISAEIIGPAFIMGLAGSLHCIGMCGPLALSLPVSHNNNLSRISGGLIYNSGRILSYTSMGLIFGSLGNLIIAAKWQSSLSIGLGIIILLYLLVPKKYFHFSTATTLGKPFMLLRQAIGKTISIKKAQLIIIYWSVKWFSSLWPCISCFDFLYYFCKPGKWRNVYVVFWIRNFSNDVCNRIDGKLFKSITAAENT